MFRVLKESDRQCNLTKKVEHFFEKQWKQSLAVSVQCQFYKVVNISKIGEKKSQQLTRKEFILQMVLLQLICHPAIMRMETIYIYSTVLLCQKLMIKQLCLQKIPMLLLLLLLFLQVKFKWTLDWIWKKVQIKDTYQYMKILSHWITKNVLFYFVL